jgi:cytochrome d ubiquinol oxidase subunit II
MATWTSPTCLLLGALSVVAFAYLAATYLTDDARRRGEEALRAYFARRALVSGALTGALGLVCLAELHHSAASTFHHLARPAALALLAASAVLGVGALAMIGLRAGRGARFLAAGAFATALWAWAVAQYPSILPRSLSLRAAAAPTASLVSEMVVFGAVVVLAGPSFVLLYVLSQRRLLEED